MKITYLCRAHTNSGGMEKTISCKANYLVSKGYEVVLITGSSESVKPFFHFDDRITVIHLKCKKGKTYFEELNNILCKLETDILISTSLKELSFPNRVKDNSKKILEIHFSKYRRKSFFTKWEKKRIGRFVTDFYAKNLVKIAGRFDRFVILTEEDKISWASSKNIEVINNPLFDVPSVYSSLENKRVITIGRFTFQKGYEYLIQAWKIVNERYPDWVLYAFGNGKLKDKYLKLIEKNGLSNTFILNNPTPNIKQEYLESSIYVQTSRYEGHPLAPMEAMSYGLPVVAFACKCGPRDIINEGEDGFLAPFKDVKIVADRLCRLIEDEELRKTMGAKARENIQRYSLDKTMQKWMDLFDELVK